MLEQRLVRRDSASLRVLGDALNRWPLGESPQRRLGARQMGAKHLRKGRVVVVANVCKAFRPGRRRGTQRGGLSALGVRLPDLEPTLVVTQQQECIANPGAKRAIILRPARQLGASVHEQLAVHRHGHRGKQCRIPRVRLWVAAGE